MIPSNADNQKENGVAGISAPLSIEAFRSWLASRPDGEHWELIAGVPMMMAPPTKAHQRIVANLVAVVPGEVAARVRPGGALRAE